jgi:hypothetical protein
MYLLFGQAIQWKSEKIKKSVGKGLETFGSWIYFLEFF